MVFKFMLKYSYVIKSKVSSLFEKVYIRVYIDFCKQTLDLTFYDVTIF